MPPGPLQELLGQDLASITFIRDYLQLGFDRPPLTLEVWPRVHSQGQLLLPSADGYLEALLALIGTQLLVADEFLDLGLTLDFEDGTRLSVPLDGTDAQGPGIAMFDRRIWTSGEPPFTDTGSAPAAG